MSRVKKSDQEKIQARLDSITSKSTISSSVLESVPVKEMTPSSEKDVLQEVMSYEAPSEIGFGDINITEMFNVPEKGPLDPKKVSFKFQEDRYLEELHKYVTATYSQHYADKLNGGQSLDAIFNSGHAEGFLIGNILKYAHRYGKKDGRNRKDILKVIHYAMIALFHHDYYVSEETRF